MRSYLWTGLELLGEHVLTQVQMKIWTTTGKEGEREGQRKNWGREVLALPVKLPAPDFNPQVPLLRGGHTAHAIFTNIPKWSFSEHSKKSAISWSSFTREGTGIGDVANSAGWVEEICGRKYQKQPPPHPRGKKKYTKPPETQTKRNKTTFSLLKKTTLETNALQEVLMYVFFTRLVEVILFWIPHKFYLHP